MHSSIIDGGTNMKKKSVLLLSLVTLSLMGCGEKTSVATEPKTSTSSPISDSASDSASDEAISDDSEVISDSSEPEPEPDSDSSSEETSLWPENVQEAMKTYLADRLIPYVNLGISPDKINTPTWDAGSSTLTIMGGLIEGDLTETQLNEAKTTYSDANWDATIDGNTMTAVNEKKDITVKYYADDGIIYLDATYTEAFEPDLYSSYPDTLVADMNSNLGGHAADIPFVYLGTANPTGTVGNGTYTITGGEWNDKIVKLANDAFYDANDKISDDENHWSYNSNTDSGSSYFYAFATLADGTKLKITITSEVYSSSSSRNIAKMIITYTPPFVPTTEGSWSSDIVKVFNDKFEKHSIPWFYTGSTAYLDYSSDTVATIVGTTGTWNDQIFELAKNAVDAENENLAEGYKWTYTSSDTGSSSGMTMWTFTRTCEDGCLLKFTVENYSTNENYGNKALIYVYYTNKYTAPEGSCWSDDTKTLIKNNLDDAEIPYVYLGTTSESASWDDATSTLTITGSTFYETVFNGAAAAFTSEAGWTGEVKTYEETNWFGNTYSYKTYEASKVVNADTGAKISVTVDSTGHYNTGNGGNCVMKIKYDKPYTVPTDVKDWDENITSFLKSYLAGHTIPFIYLNMPFSSLTTGHSNWTGTYIIGGEWDDGILTHANTQLTADNWNITSSDSTSCSLNATKTETDGCVISLKLYKTNTGVARLELYITEAFSDIATEWTDDVKADMQACLGGNVIPFIQLGSPNMYTATYKPKKNYMMVATDVWSDTATANAKAALDASNEGWVTLMNEYDTSNPDQLNAFKINSDGSAIYLSLYKSGSGAYLSLYYYAATTYSDDKKTGWTDSETAYLNTLTENHATYVPYLYMGDGNYTLDSNNDKVIGTTYDKISILKYYSTLKDAGYTKFGFNVTSSSMTLMAGYTDSSNNDVYLEVGYDYDDDAELVTALTVSYKPVFTLPSAEESKWSDDVTSKITTCLGEGETLPYVFIGSKNPKVKLSSDNSKLEIYSNCWDDQIVDLAYTAFTSSSDGWTVVKDLYDNQVIASRKTSSGKIIKVVVSKHTTSGSSLEYAYIEVYVK